MRFHTNLPVEDIEATSRFYAALLGSAPVKKKKDYVKFLPESGGLNLAFHQSDSWALKPSDLHLGFEMPNQTQMERLLLRLREAGLDVSERETSVCCYAKQDKCKVRDPDGYEWEIYTLLEDTDAKMSAQSSCCGQDDGAVSPCG